jgi:hypothetical protein
MAFEGLIRSFADRYFLANAGEQELEAGRVSRVSSAQSR